MIPTLWGVNRRGARKQQFPLLSLFDEVNRLFEDSPTAFTSAAAGSAFVPSIDLQDLAEKYVVSCELPGLEAKDVQIEVIDNAITVSGEKRTEHEQKEGARIYRERTVGRFSRTIPFDSEVDEDKAVAEMKKGILTIEVPKSAKEIKGAKKISIKSS